MRRTLLVALVAGSQACWSTKPPPVVPTPATPTARYGNDYAATISDPLGFLPADAELVFAIDAARLRQSSLWQTFEPLVFDKLEPAFGMLRRGCGFDPLVELQSITMGASKLDGTMAATLVIRGLDRARVMACFKKGAVPKDATFDGEHLVYQSNGSSDMVAQFIDATTAIVIVGEKVTLAQLSSAVHSGAPLRSSSAFASLFDEIDSERAMWFIMHGDMKSMQNLSIGARAEALFATIDVGDALVANAHLRVDTAAGATQFVAKMHGQMSIVKNMFERFEFTAVDRDVVIDIAATEPQVTQIVTLVGIGMPSSQPAPNPPTLPMP